MDMKLAGLVDFFLLMLYRIISVLPNLQVPCDQ